MMGNSLIKRNKKNEKTLSRKTNSNKSNENDNKVHTSRHHFVIKDISTTILFLNISIMRRKEVSNIQMSGVKLAMVQNTFLNDHIGFNLLVFP